MKIVKATESIYEIVTKYPQIKDALFELGFVDIMKPGMINTAGRIMTLSKGSKMKKIPLSEIAAKLETYGFELKEE